MAKETLIHKNAFLCWYEFDRDFRKTSEKLVTPGTTLRGWSERFDWNDRADELDRQAEMARRQELIEERQKQMQREREAGWLLQEAGAKFLRKRGAIDSAKDAVQAVKVGADLSRRGLGMPLREETLNLRVMEKMTDDELLAIIAEDLQAQFRVGPGGAADPGDEEDTEG